MSNSDVILFGCWNKGYCDVRKKKTMNGLSLVMNSLQQKKNIKCIFVMGDNYYSDINNKKRIFNNDNFVSGFDCLNNLSTDNTFILYGNHEYNDKYDNAKCTSVKKQLNYVKHNEHLTYYSQDIEPYVINNKCYIMIDSNIYTKYTNKECLNYVYGNNYSKTEQTKLLINKIKNIKNVDKKELVIIGHHPIITQHKNEHTEIIKGLISLMVKICKISNKVSYICADTHYYEQGTIKITNTNNETFVVNQYIVGTGGANLDEPRTDKKKLIHKQGIYNVTYNLICNMKTSGYLVSNNQGYKFIDVVPKKGKYVYDDKYNMYVWSL